MEEDKRDVHPRVIRKILDHFEMQLLDCDYDVWWMDDQIDRFIAKIEKGELSFLNHIK